MEVLQYIPYVGFENVRCLFFFQVKSFRSYCGGLPAPEHADNPLRYKFRYYAYSLIKYQFVYANL